MLRILIAVRCSYNNCIKMHSNASLMRHAMYASRGECINMKSGPYA